MIRKSIFLGLMIMLGAVLVSLVLRGRKEEAQKKTISSEVVKTAKSTATRVMSPAELDVSESKVEITPATAGSGKAARPVARCDVRIRNTGRLAYHDIMLRLDCFDKRGQLLDSKMQQVPETIWPGQTLRVENVKIEDLPAGAVKGTLHALFAGFDPGVVR